MMDKEYIEREALIRDLIDNYSFYPALVKNVIKRQPTADVVEVRHGEWVSARPSGGYDFYCSCCKEFAITYEDNNYREQYHLTDYCPNCGAKMDGKGDSNG